MAYLRSNHPLNLPGSLRKVTLDSGSNSQRFFGTCHFGSAGEPLAPVEVARATMKQDGRRILLVWKENPLLRM